MDSRIRIGIGVGLIAATWLLLDRSLVWVGLWPSFVALTLVAVFRRVVAGLVGGAFCGAVLLCEGNPATAFVSLFEEHLLPAFGSPWKSGAVLFTLVLGGFASVIEKGGGLGAIFRRLLRDGSGRRVEAAAAGLGLICFFDGLANSLMVGRLFRGLADRADVPRVRLAYIVDTTSSAVACVAIVSTWIAYQLAMIQEGLELAGAAGEWKPYTLFWQSLPYNFYCWFALILLAVAIWRRWDLGPMRRASGSTPSTNSVAPEIDERSDSEEQSAAWRALFPLAALLGLILGGIYLDGAHRAEIALWPVTFQGLSSAFGSAQAAVVLVWASVLASLLAIAVYPPTREKPTAVQAFEQGVHALLGPVMILLAAWILSSVLDGLGAVDALGQLLAGNTSLAWLPVGVFLVGALTSFTTGTSWGTMGLLMPLAIPLCFQLAPEGLDASSEALALALAGVVGAVFSGAVFGDHCSPLSDTTIVSSIACGIEPHEHVRTQLPYALLAGGVAILCGFLPLFLLPLPGMLLAIGAALLVMIGWLATQNRKKTPQ
jgi:Na+/H+ antiporter NhaC